MQTNLDEPQYKKGNELIVCLLKLDLTVIEVMGCLGKVEQKRIEKSRENPDHILHTPRPTTSWSSFSEAEKLTMKESIMSLDVEDGFPCSHRQPKQYVALEETWTFIMSSTAVIVITRQGHFSINASFSIGNFSFRTLSSKGQRRTCAIVV